MKPKLILGIGNILLSDEGVGVAAIERMQPMALPADVEVLDGGTSGADLVDSLADRAKVVVIDCIAADGPPGTILRMSADDMVGEDQKLSLHQLGLLDSLLMARHLGCPPKEVIVVGVIPATLACNIGLSPAVEAAMPKLIQAALAEAAR